MKNLKYLLLSVLLISFFIKGDLLAQKLETPVISGGLDKGDCISRIFVSFKNTKITSDYLYNVYWAEGETKDLAKFKFVGTTHESNGGHPIGILAQGLGPISTIYVTAYNKEFESDISNLLVVKLNSCKPAEIIRIAGSIEGLLSKISTPRLNWAGDKGFCNARILMENVDNPYKTQYHVYHTFGKTTDLKLFKYLGTVQESNSSGMGDLRIAGILVENIPGISSVYVICELDGVKSEMSNVLNFEVAKNKYCIDDNPPKVSPIENSTTVENNTLNDISVKLYPNPVSNILFVNGLNFKNYCCQVIDLVGNVVYNSDNLNTENLQINLEYLKSGNYYLRINSNEFYKVIPFRIIK